MTVLEMIRADNKRIIETLGKNKRPNLYIQEKLKKNQNVTKDERPS